MAVGETPRSNFGFLEAHDEQLVRLGMLAERYFPDDPNTSLLKLRQVAELLAQLVATKVGVYASREEAQYDLLRRLQDQVILPREVAQLFGEEAIDAAHVASGWPIQDPEQPKLGGRQGPRHPKVAARQPPPGPRLRPGVPR